MLKRRSKKNTSAEFSKEKTKSKIVGLKIRGQITTRHAESHQQPNVKSLACGTCFGSPEVTTSTLLASGTMNEGRSSVATMATMSNSFNSAHSPTEARKENEDIVLVLDEASSSNRNENHFDTVPAIPLHDAIKPKNNFIPLFVTTARASPASTTRLLSASFPDSMSVPFEDTMPSSGKSQLEHAYWMKILSGRIEQFGTVHMETAIAYFSVGQSFLRRQQYPEAIAAFLEACKIYKTIHGPNHLSVAQALDCYGLACMNLKQFVPAEKALKRAFRIRSHHLGVWHVDTVSTFNRIASVHLRMGELETALGEYKEVFKVRRAIFGADHPAVAITAHALANVHGKLGQTRESNMFFALAQRIYRKMGLSHDHRTVAKLLSDQIKQSRSKAPVAKSNYFLFF
eukprot:scaffold4481_cov121-Cylindrotheca_fusiformis.AAC.13